EAERSAATRATNRAPTAAPDGCTTRHGIWHGQSDRRVGPEQRRPPAPIPAHCRGIKTAARTPPGRGRRRFANKGREIMRNIWAYRFFATFFVAIGAFCLPAQTLDTGVLGTITDPTGAVVAGAAVNITQTATGVRRTTQTAADGKYEVRYLVPGEYSIEV